MSDLYKYTFAELEFLLGGRPGWPHGREMLGLNPESTEGIRMAGAASLLVRGLAKVDGADIVVDPAVMMPASVLVSGGEVFGLALSGNGRMALSTLVIVPSSSLPIFSRRRDLSMVRICSSRITLSRLRPTLWADSSMWVGSRALPTWLVIAAAITVGLCRLPVSF